jgi:hypothetical protein
MVQEQREQEREKEEVTMVKKKFVDEAGYMRVGLRLPGDMMRRLRIIAAEEDTTITELLIEGINKVFAERYKDKDKNQQPATKEGTKKKSL